MLGERFLGVDSKEEQLSRRNFLLGIGLASAVALPMLSAPARAAVSMLRTGLDPDLVETESEVIPAGKRGGGGGRAAAAARAAAAVARAAVEVTMVANIMAAVANTMAAVANTMAAVANTMAAVANTMAAVANTMAAVANTMADIVGMVMAMDITSIDTVMVAAGGMVAGMPGVGLAGSGLRPMAGFGSATDAAATD